MRSLADVHIDEKRMTELKEDRSETTIYMLHNVGGGDFEKTTWKRSFEGYAGERNQSQPQPERICACCFMKGHIVLVFEDGQSRSHSAVYECDSKSGGCGGITIYDYLTGS